MKRTSFFLHGRLVAEGTTGKHFVHASHEYPKGQFFFCPTCCTIWASRYVEGEKGYVLHRDCEKHPSTVLENLKGSLWLSYDDAWNRNLPTELLAREFLLLTEFLNNE